MIWDCIKLVFNCKKHLDKYDNGVKLLREQIVKDQGSIFEKTERIIKLTKELDHYQNQISYSFIPENWNKVGGSVVTTKYFQDGIKLKLDVRDLLNSTVYSRKWADDLIKIIPESDSRDDYFVNIALITANKVITDIKYVTNKKQFNVMDRWNNGDTCIVTGVGDCDLATRVFVRVMNDILDKLKMWEYKKYVFQAVGFWMKTIGHSWGVIFNPVTKEFNIIECTYDKPYNSLKKIPKNYDMWFCLNFKKVWYMDPSWRSFL